MPAAGVGVGINANPTVPPSEDRARLFARNTSLRTLAEATDGIAVVDTNDLSRGLRRISDDLAWLQELLDRSHAAGGPHLRSIITPERRLTAATLAERLQGMCLLVVATVTADGLVLVCKRRVAIYNFPARIRRARQ